MQGETAPAVKWRPNAFWIAVAIYFAFISVGSNLLEIRYSYFDPEQAGSWGFSFTRQGPDAIVDSVDPGSRAAAIGLRAGDRLHSDQPNFFRTIPVAGETLRFARVAPAPQKAFQFDSTRADQPPMVVPNLLDRVLDDGVRVILALGGLLILWRGSNRRSGFLFGLAFLAMSPFPTQWLPLGPLASYLSNIAVFSLIDLEFGLLMPLFAMAFLTESGVRCPAWAKLLVWAGAAETMVGYLFIWVLPPTVFAGAALDIANQLRIPVSLAIFVVTVALLVMGWRRGAAEIRHRFAPLLIAVGLIYLSNMLYALFYSWSDTNPRLLTNVSTSGRALGSSLFAYAVLRHKVIDVGFTLNRTLVYGGVSAILLAAFGLAEWGLHQVLALEGWEGSALLNAGLAVAIFLGFHPVRHFVEHHVSTIFFRPWRDKQQALRKFVHEGGFFTDGCRLAKAFAGALEEFTGGSCCVYRVADGQFYVCATGKMLPVHFDDPVAVALRRRRPSAQSSPARPVSKACSPSR